MNPKKETNKPAKTSCQLRSRRGAAQITFCDIEKVLNNSEKLYRLLAESSNDCIFIFSKNSKIQYINRFGASLLGKHPEEVIGKALADIFPKKFFKIQKRLIKLVASSARTHTFDNKIFCPRKPLWLNTTLIPIKNSENKVVSILGISRDVTDRKKAEESALRSYQQLEKLVEKRTLHLKKEMASRENIEAALRESEQRYRLISENANDLIALHSLKDLSYRYVNPATTRVLGYSSKELIGKSAFNFFHPEDRDKVLKDLKEGLNCGYGTSEFRYRKKSGKYIWLDRKSVV